MTDDSTKDFSQRNKVDRAQFRRLVGLNATICDKSNFSERDRLLSMSTSNFSKNLRMLCSYAPSISEVARKLKINRQQFHRYLSGESEPSLQRLRLLADYFGLDDSEILLEHDDFKKLISVKGVHPDAKDPLTEQITKQLNLSRDGANKMNPILGFYYSYYHAHEAGDMINKSLVHVYEKEGSIFTKTIENFSNVKYRNRKILKYRGFAYSIGQEVYIQERELFTGRMVWTTVLNFPDEDQFSILTGLTIGVSSTSQRRIAAYRMLWERIPDQVSMRERIAGCGIYPKRSENISSDFVRALSNQTSDSDIGFASLPWTGESG